MLGSIVREKIDDFVEDSVFWGCLGGGSCVHGFRFPAREFIRVVHKMVERKLQKSSFSRQSFILSIFVI